MSYQTADMTLYELYEDGEEIGAVEGTSKRNALWRWAEIHGLLPEDAYEPGAYSKDDPVPGLEDRDIEVVETEVQTQ